MQKINFYEKLIKEAGLTLTPLHDKVPFLKEWQTKHLTFEEFEQHFKDNRCNNIGLVCVDGVEVIDIDLKVYPTLKEQNDFYNELLSLLNDNIDEFDKKFVIVKTINAGYHILFKSDEQGHNQKLAKINGHKQYIIETRGLGGQVVIYDNFVQNNYLKIQHISNRDREILISCCKTFNYIEDVKDEVKQHDIVFHENTVTSWDDFNAKTRIWDLISDEFDIVKRLSDKLIIKRKGSENPYNGSILTNREILFLFTPNTCYPAEKGLSPFGVYSWKYHNGNFSNSAKDLYHKGFGTRLIKDVQELKEDVHEEIINEVEFPIDIFPIDIQNYFIDCRDTLNSSIDYMACSFLWMLSLIVGNTFKVRVKNGWIEAGILWIIIVGKQGIGKTPSINNIIYPIRNINKAEAKRYGRELKRYEEYLELSKEDKKNSVEIKKPTKTQFIVNDITQEALISTHEQVPNALGVFRDEIAGWIKDMNKYRAGSDKEFWLDSWNNKEWFKDRVTSKSAMIDQMFMPILGGVQPTIFSEFYTADNEENGFIDRLLISYPELVVNNYNEDEINENIITWYSDFITNLFNYVKAWTNYLDDGDIVPNICYFSGAAKKEWERIFNDITARENSDFENEYMKSMYPKQKSYIPRFALLLHVLDIYASGKNFSSLIEKDSIVKAEKISNYFVNNAKKIKIGNKADKVIEKQIINSKSKSDREICLELFKANKNINKSDLARKFKVSRVTINNWLK